MRYTEHLWQSIATLYQAIIQHPFNVELAAGTLPREKFLFYIQQDALYLVDFGKALAMMAGRSETPRQVLEFTRWAQEVILTERGLHESYFQVFGVSEPTAELSPANFAYTNYLLSTAGPPFLRGRLRRVATVFLDLSRSGASHSSAGGSAQSLSTVD